MSNTIFRLLSWVSVASILLGSIVTIVGTTEPWANAVLFEHLHVSVPGLVFVLGSIAAVAAITCLFTARLPLICLLLGVVIVSLTFVADATVPYDVRGYLQQAQTSFTPLNELLIKFGLDTVMVGNYIGKDSEYIGVGLQTTLLGGGLIVVGSILGLPQDPLVKRSYRKMIKENCEECGARWHLNRDVLFCPKCATPTPRAYGVCRHCGNSLLAPDKYCVKCGTPRS